MLHNMGEINKVECEMNSGVSTEITTENDDILCNPEGLMFTQFDIDRLVD